MKYIIIEPKKIILFWSPKSGSTSIIAMLLKYYNITVANSYQTHFWKYYESDISCRFQSNKNYDDYNIIVVVRNPYHRIVSGFIGKFCRKNAPNKMIDGCVNFEDFVNIFHNNPDIVLNIDREHFSFQTDGEGYDFLNKLSKYKNIKFYDINEIDKIAKILNVPGCNLNNRKILNSGKQLLTKYVYNLNYLLLDNYLITNYSLFYNENIKSKVYEIYQDDFVFCSHYIHYTI